MTTVIININKKLLKPNIRCDWKTVSSHLANQKRPKSRCVFVHVFWSTSGWRPHKKEKCHKNLNYEWKAFLHGAFCHFVNLVTVVKLISSLYKQADCVTPVRWWRRWGHQKDITDPPVLLSGRVRRVKRFCGEPRVPHKFHGHCTHFVPRKTSSSTEQKSWSVPEMLIPMTNPKSKWQKRITDIWIISKKIKKLERKVWEEY